jgi:hypothetical protein
MHFGPCENHREGSTPRSIAPPSAWGSCASAQQENMHNARPAASGDIFAMRKFNPLLEYSLSISRREVALKRNRPMWLAIGTNHQKL